MPSLEAPFFGGHRAILSRNSFWLQVADDESPAEDAADEADESDDVVHDPPSTSSSREGRLEGSAPCPELAQHARTNHRKAKERLQSRASPPGPRG